MTQTPDASGSTTAASTSRIETVASPSKAAVHDGSRDDSDIQDAELRHLSRTVRRATAANEALDHAIAAARVAGHSWRTIAHHTGIPFQTLHQRSQRAANPTAPQSPGG